MDKKKDIIALSGMFHIQLLDKDGKIKQEFDAPNGIVDEGLNHILETEFRSGAAIANWFIGLVDNAGFSAFADADTMSSHAGWTEDVNYSEATRPQWSPGAAASRSIINGSTVDFSMDATTVIEGIFITSGSAKSGTSGTLWSTASFASDVNATNGDTIKVTYSLQG